MLVKTKTGPLFLTAAAGVLMVGEWFFNIPILDGAAAAIKSWVMIIEAFALLVGSVNILIVNGKIVQRKETGWYGNAVLILVLLLFAGVGMITGVDSAISSKLFDAVITPSGVALTGFVSFYLFSAGARALRFKNVDSAIIMTVILIALICQVPTGEMFAPWLVSVLDWLMNVVNVAGQRGIIIGAAFGAFVQAIRTLIGLERTIGLGA